MYKPISEVGELKFNSCEGCAHNCCTPQGGFSLAPLILEDFIEVYERFPIVFAYVNQVFKCVIILNNGEKDCIYFDDKKRLCTIYENRPPACNMYPISPLFDDICVDTSCHAVGDIGDFLCNKDGFSNSFYHKRVEGFYPKLRNTQKFLNQIRYTTTQVKTIVGIDLFKLADDAEYDEEFQPFVDMHAKSLQFLDNY